MGTPGTFCFDQALQVALIQVVLGTHFEQPHRIAACTSATWPSKDTVLQVVVLAWYNYILSNHQSEAFLLIYPKSKKKISHGHFFLYHDEEIRLSLSYEPLRTETEETIWWAELVEQKQHEHHCFMPWNSGQFLSPCVKVIPAS